MNLTHTTSDRRAFVRTLLRHPARLGALAPSSARLAELAAAVVPDRGAPVVVELGAGAGVITDRIRRRLPPDGRLVAVEIDEDLCQHLQRSRPWLEVVCGDARELTTLLQARSAPRADVIISTLPWTLFDSATRDHMLAQITATLAPHGVMVTVVTLPALVTPAAWRFRGQLRQAFDTLTVTAPVWANMPPAVLYDCRLHPPSPTGDEADNRKR